MAPANASDFVPAAGAGADSRHDATLLDRKTREPPSYSPPIYSQSTKAPIEPSKTPTPAPTQDVKVLPFRELSRVNAQQLPPIQTSPAGRDSSSVRQHKPLPSISSVTGSVRSVASLTSVTTTDSVDDAPYPTTTNHWPSLNPLTAYYSPTAADSPRMDLDNVSTSTGPISSPDRFSTDDVRAASLSIEDPDVRLAAEALGDLRADFLSSPPARNSPLPGNQQTSEPLFSLLTTSHPLLAKTIEGTTSAYNTSKNYSPRFKSGAEYVEGYLSPIGNTIGSVSRVTGVEGGVRWFLGGGRRRNNGEGESSKTSFYKRRKVDPRRGGRSGTPSAEAHNSSAPKSQFLQPATGASRAARTSTEANGAAASRDRFDFQEDHRLSMSTVETLPAYDDHRSPAYTESVTTDGGSLMRIESAASGSTAASSSQQQEQQQVAGQPAAWQTRLIMSTSGLSVAMSEESLRSLKYCLNWLRWANGNIDKVIESLKTALDQYDSAGRASEEAAAQAAQNGSPSEERAKEETAAAQANRNELAARIATLRGDLLQTLRGAVDTVSKYAGGALPDNARDLVKRHLTSLPQRFRLANQAEAEAEAQRASAGGGRRPATDKEVREGAQRVLVLAKEGLDMMSQVSGVLDGTIVSAEEWCERLGKKKQAEQEQQQQQVGGGSEGQAATPAATPAAMATEADGDVVMQ